MTDGTAVVPGPLKLDLADAPGTPIKHASRGRYKPRAQPVKPADLIVQERFADFGREATISQDELSSFKYISKGEGMHGAQHTAGRKRDQALVSERFAEHVVYTR